MRADKSDGFGKKWICHRRHRDQKMTSKINVFQCVYFTLYNFFDAGAARLNLNIMP